MDSFCRGDALNAWRVGEGDVKGKAGAHSSRVVGDWLPALGLRLGLFWRTMR